MITWQGLLLGFAFGFGVGTMLTIWHWRAVEAGSVPDNSPGDSNLDTQTPANPTGDSDTDYLSETRAALLRNDRTN